MDHALIKYWRHAKSDDLLVLDDPFKSEEFKQKYKQTDMTLDYVIRDRLHTAIFLGQKGNLLESMDGSLFDLPDNQSAKELTDQVIALIGSMYYGANEVEQLENN